MIEAFLLALLAFLAILPIVLPLLNNGRPVAERAAFDQAVYRDQLRELEREIERGLLTPGDAEASRLEIQRRLLAADRRQARAARLTRSPLLAAAVLLFVGGGAIGTYLLLGSPGLPDEPFADRPPAQHGDDTAQMRNAVEALAKRLQQNPNDGAGWLLFARSLSTMGDYNRALVAYEQAIKLGQNSPDVQADHAEMMVLKADGMVTPAAEQAFKAVLMAAPNNAAARYYLALARMQAGEPKHAIQGFQALLAILPSDSPLRGQIGGEIAQAAKQAGIPVPALEKGAGPTAQLADDADKPADTAAAGGGSAGQPAAGPSAAGPSTPGPSTADMAAAANMTDAQRQAMIRGMVAKLAASQAADPNNFDGWMRLGRAYMVLQETDKAEDAYARARALRPNDITVPEAEAQALMTGYKPGQKLPPRAVHLFQEVLAKDPERPAALWYLGLAAAMDGDKATARQHWTALHDLLPANSPERKMVENALATLPKPADGGAAPTAK